MPGYNVFISCSNTDSGVLITAAKTFNSQRYRLNSTIKVIQNKPKLVACL